MSAYPHLAARLFNTPLMVLPAKLDAIIAGLGGRLLGVDGLTLPAAQSAAPEMLSTRRSEQHPGGWRLDSGVAVIDVRGALVHRTRLEADSTSLLGYDDIAAAFQSALASDDARAIALVIDSPGGEVQGAFELASRIHAARGQKPVIAIADGMAASAAYLIASAADEVLATPTSYTGSIGIVMRHVDMSRALSKEGLQVTHIFAGAHKVDGNPYEPLPGNVRHALQADIDGLYDDFVQAVALHRGLPDQAVRDTQAQVYRGAAALPTGLIDRISTVDDAIAQLAALVAAPAPKKAMAAPNRKGNTMTHPEATAAPAAQEQALQAAREQGHADGLSEGIRQGTQAERERTAAILGHERAAACPDLARQCIATGLTAEQASAILGAAPAPAATASAGFAQHMAALNPDVSGIEAAASPADDAAAIAAQVLQHARHA